MQKATVKWFDNKKGYGFLVTQTHGDVFVHYKNIEGTGYKVLKEGQDVVCVIEQRDKGVYATSVTPLC